MKVTMVKTVRGDETRYSVRGGKKGKGNLLFLSLGRGNKGADVAYDQMEKFLRVNDHLIVVNRKGFDQE
jgi:hypothetical protein